MRLNKRGVAAIALVVCLLITSCTVFGAIVEIPNGNSIPAEGVAVTFAQSGSANKVTEGLAFVLNSGEEKKLGVDIQNFSASELNGNLISGDVTYRLRADGSENDKGIVEAFTLVDLPIEAIRTNGTGTSLCLEVTKASIVDHSLELTSVDQLGAESGAFTLKNAIVKPGIREVDTKAFPENTVFISSANVIDDPKDWAWNENVDGYSFYMKNVAVGVSSQVDGPSVSFMAKQSGTYDLWAYRKDLSDTSVDRYLRILINGETYSFLKNNASSAHAWFWEKENSNRQVTLNEGDVVTIQLSKSSGNYGRFGAIALVPAEAQFTLTPEQAQSADNKLLQTDLIALQTATTNPMPSAGADVNVTVNEQPVVAEAWAAKNQEVAVRVFDLSGNYIINPTVADALVCAGIDISAMAQGNVASISVSLNGQVITDLDVTYVSEGDIITTTEATLEDFAPSPFGSLLSAVGGGDGTKFCISKVRLAELPCVTLDEDGYLADPSELIGCHISGYLVVKDVQDNTVVDGNKPYLDLVESGYVFLDNLEITKAENNPANNRVDIYVDFPCRGLNECHYFDEDGTYLGERDDCLNVTKGWNVTYDWTNLFITNKNAQSGIRAEKAGNSYVLKTDAVEYAYVIRVQYDAENKIESIDVDDDVIISVNNPVTIEVGENEKVYVWENVRYQGTTLRPLCAPLVR